MSGLHSFPVRSSGCSTRSSMCGTASFASVSRPRRRGNGYRCAFRLIGQCLRAHAGARPGPGRRSYTVPPKPVRPDRSRSKSEHPGNAHTMARFCFDQRARHAEPDCRTLDPLRSGRDRVAAISARPQSGRPFGCHRDCRTRQVGPPRQLCPYTILYVHIVRSTYEHGIRDLLVTCRRERPAVRMYRFSIPACAVLP